MVSKGHRPTATASVHRRGDGYQCRRLCRPLRVILMSCCLLLGSTSMTNGLLTSRTYISPRYPSLLPSLQKKSARTSPSSLSAVSKDELALLERTKRQLQKLQQGRVADDDELETQIRNYLRLPANELKERLKGTGLPTKGRKPDLARRLAEYEWQLEHGRLPDKDQENDEQEAIQQRQKQQQSHGDHTVSDGGVVKQFCGLKLSRAAGIALGQASFSQPTAIQEQAIPLLSRGESAILHAETGSGKTLAYLLPITEALWREEQDGDDEDELHYGMILTPTRELAAQVAGVASVLAPPGSVRLVTHATNLMSDQRYWKERQGGTPNADIAREEDLQMGRTSPRLFVGSAKAIMHSLYGDGKMPASPTRKPLAQELLGRTRWVVLDEVDRILLQGKKTSSRSGSTSPVHEKPAAIVTSAVARRTFGRAQVIAASATVGRTLKREMSRVLGLPPKEWPRVVRGNESVTTNERTESQSHNEEASSGHVGRAVTIPETVKNYVVAVDTSSVGKLLTNAFFVLKALNEGDQKDRRKILMVLTRGCGISTQNAIGALKHFRCQPEPMSLLDVLQSADGADQLIEVHRQVSGSTGVGASTASSYFQQKNDDSVNEDEPTDLDDVRDDDGDDQTSGYLLVTGEDTVRGLHLDGLDTVVVVGRAHGPDEYTHIAGRTGRAGRPGQVVNVLSESHAAAVRGWEKMLNVEFDVLDMDEVRLLP
mmetsp:Transcript_12994/g.24377  ORF Transcript_12994/g.24377 Transcript_12994/m.24377 type:complete len:712 (+) Transcript_12994:174-2309(+)